MIVMESITSLGNTMTQRLGALHQKALVMAPSLERVAFAIYEQKTDLLKTYIHSTRNGTALTSYQFPLRDSKSLMNIAETGQPRLIRDIGKTLRENSQHSQWVLNQGYKSSFTVPIYNKGELLGLVFFDSNEVDMFDLSIQKELILLCNLIAMTVALEVDAVKTIVASTEVANEFIHLRDFETGAHLERMARYTRLIACHLSEKHQLDDEYIERLYRAAPLHDVGKIGISDSILFKPDRLEPEQWQIMQSHVKKGEHIAKRVLASLGLENCAESQLIVNVIAQHHEFLDGSGYPRQLKGEQVSLEARIVTVADIFDALTSERPYKKAWSFDRAIEELYNMASTGKLAKECVDALVSQKTQIKSIMQMYQD